jgi:DNA polymerase
MFEIVPRFFPARFGCYDARRGTFMDERAKNRVRLWLKSEQAFGLSSVAAPTQAQRCDVETPAPPPADAKAQPAPPTRDLFGRVETKPAPPLVPLPTVPAFDAPELPTEEKRRRLIALDSNEVRGCTKCRLCETRTNTVFGEGAADAKIFFIGEGPGQTEDETGRPFVGRAGELLDKMIVAMGLKREQVFIANIVKCRPPGNREPAPDEVATCTPYLERQLEIVRPKVIVTLGRPAMQHMLQTKTSMGRLRGQWQTWRGIRLMPTFHPAFLLRSYTPGNRAAVWSDLQQVLVELGLPLTKKGAGGA